MDIRSVFCPLLVILMFVGTQSHSQQIVSWTVDGRKFQYFTGTRTFSAASNKCESIGANVLEINTKEIYSAVVEMLRLYGNEINSEYVWINASYSQSLALCSEGGSCALFRKHTGKLESASCSGNFAYICQSEFTDTDQYRHLEVNKPGYQYALFSPKRYNDASQICTDWNSRLWSVSSSSYDRDLGALIGERENDTLYWADGDQSDDVEYSGREQGKKNCFVRQPYSQTVVHHDCRDTVNFICQRIPPKLVTYFPSTGQLNFSEELRMNCTFDGSPLPEIKWRISKTNGNLQEIVSGRHDSQMEVSIKKFGSNRVTSTLRISLARWVAFENVACYTYSASKNFRRAENVVRIDAKNYLFSQDGIHVNLEGARNRCISEGGSLATILDARIHMLKSKILDDSARFWSGSSHGFIGVTTDRESRWTVERYHQSCRNCTCFSEMWSLKRCCEDCMTEMGYICEFQDVGKPVIENINIDLCDPIVSITWRPHETALNITHRAQYKTKLHGRRFPPQNKLPEAFGNKMNASLDASTSYIFTVTACPDFCDEHLVTENELRTNPLSRVVSARAQITDDDRCIFSWEGPEIEQSPINYEIKVDETTYNARHTSPPTHSIRNATAYSYKNTMKLDMLPNRRYKFGIKAEECSTFFKVETTCTRFPEAPEYVPVPNIGINTKDDGTRDVEINFPDESNGPISCLFVIVRYDEEEITIEDKFPTSYTLRKAEHASSFGSAKPGNEYIAMALRLNGDRNTYSGTLGSNERSECNPMTIKDQRRYSDSFNSKNFRLKNEGQQYSVYTVSATPSGKEKILYERSHTLSFQSGSKPYGLIIGAVVISLLFVVILALLVRFVKKRYLKSSSPSTIATPAISPVQSQEPQYANLARTNCPSRSSTDIQLQMLQKVYEALIANDNMILREQFESLKRVATTYNLSTGAATLGSNMGKNRYKNILPYDNTRVQLNGGLERSYINACFVDGYNQSKKFIATQGPLPNTVDDFWRMVVEQQCRVIIMLTQCTEGGKIKCEKYWPDRGIIQRSEGITIINEQETVYAGTYIKRILTISYGTQERITVQQLHFLQWPDHGVPNTTSTFLRFYKMMVVCHRSGYSRSPIIIHCSAGAGRTGAFIGYDYLLEESQSVNRIDVCSCILKMRKQRAEMVQTSEQFAFIHKLLLENFLLGSTDIDLVTFEANMSNLQSKEKRMSEYNKQFSRLRLVKPLLIQTCGMLAKQQRMNRNKNIVPYEHTKVVVMRELDDTDTPYINASYVEAYDTMCPMIAAQGPMSTTIQYFWRAVLDNRVSTIVMLTKCLEGQCEQYWPNNIGDTVTVGSVTVTLKRESVRLDITQREIHVQRQNDLKIINHFQYTGWSPSLCPTDAKPVLALVSKMQENVHADTNSTALIHCSDGAGRTGTFCAIVNLIERLKFENRIDVSGAVKDLRDCRPGMVQHEEQYRFCYDAVSTYLATRSQHAGRLQNEDDYDTYENA